MMAEPKQGRRAMENPPEWNSLADFIKAVYNAQVYGIVDPRLEPYKPAENCGYLTEDELRRIEEWGKEIEEGE